MRQQRGSTGIYLSDRLPRNRSIKDQSPQLAPRALVEAAY
jgi:hypothetical protein